VNVKSGDYFQQKGALAEGIIHSLATETFFTDWCYPNPKKPDGKELCDLLVVFDDTAIIWQIKDLKVDDQGRYKKAEVEKNLKQLGGAWRALFDLKTPIVLSNPRRGPEQFDPSSIKHIHLISVLMGDSTEPMGLMPEIKGHTVHVFTKAFADIALKELDTVSDFCRYLRAKEDVVGATSMIVHGGEENLLGKYIELGRNFEWLKKYDRAIIHDGIWETIESMPQYIKKKELDAISYGWDSIIDRAHEGSPKYEIVARELARPDRLARRILAKDFMGGYSELMASDGQMIRRKMTHLDTTYCFLITSDDNHKSPRIVDMLTKMCFVARGLNPEIERVVGVATTRGNNGYNFLFLNKPTWSAEDEALKRQIQDAYGIFKNPRITETSEDEYPPMEDAEGK
jgi:hypothetical protein